MADNQWTVQVKNVCPECHQPKLVFDDSDQDFDRYNCRDCGAIVEIWFERMSSKIVVLDDDYEIKREVWSV